MKVTENNKLRTEVMRSLTGERFASRTFSVTKLTCCPRKTYYSMSGVKTVTSDASVLFMARGRGLHYELQKDFMKKEIRVEREGIRGDIDVISERIIEMYTTNMSLKKVQDIDKVPEVFEAKVKQLMAYCSMTGKTEGDILVYFMSGDYNKFTEVLGLGKVYTGIQPELKCWTLEFTKDELKENWEKILSNREDIEYALRTGQPPLTVGEKWECKVCDYYNICFGEEAVGESQELSIESSTEPSIFPDPEVYKGEDEK